MDRGVLLLLCLNFVYIAILPVVFFRKDGEMNLRWLFTALPFAASPCGIIASYHGYLPRLTGTESPWGGFSDSLAVLLAVISISLISYTLGTHKIPIALWHQDNDDPKSIVTFGAYKYIRHPFYAAFIVAFVAAFIYAPQILTICSLLYGLIVLNSTATSEEKRLCGSDFGEEYKVYMEHTGRFLPMIADKESK